MFLIFILSLASAQDPVTLYMDSDASRIVMGPMEESPIIAQRMDDGSLNINTVLETEDLVVGNSTYSELVELVDIQQAQLTSAVSEVAALKTLIEQIQLKYNLNI